MLPVTLAVIGAKRSASVRKLSAKNLTYPKNLSSPPAASAIASVIAMLASVNTPEVLKPTKPILFKDKLIFSLVSITLVTVCNIPSPNFWNLVKLANSPLVVSSKIPLTIELNSFSRSAPFNPRKLANLSILTVPSFSMTSAACIPNLAPL